jgi:hypothetical protein
MIWGLDLEKKRNKNDQFWTRQSARSSKTSNAMETPDWKRPQLNKQRLLPSSPDRLNTHYSGCLLDSGASKTISCLQANFNDTRDVTVRTDTNS